MTQTQKPFDIEAEMVKLSKGFGGEWVSLCLMDGVWQAQRTNAWSREIPPSKTAQEALELLQKEIGKEKP